ncbi:hypothetical protein [Halorientalis halophila]|uniref:hypothetical protein n=1 Tax=Halorientalis halophila TaxID=3108499 RepID=UPI00300A3AC2
MHRRTSRRRFVAGAGVVLAGGLAGCSGAEEGIDVIVSNGLDSERDYRLSVADFEEEGSLGSGESDAFEDVVERPSERTTVPVDVSFGISLEGEENGSEANGTTTNDSEGERDFFESSGGEDEIEVVSETRRITVSLTEMGLFVGSTTETPTDS